MGTSKPAAFSLTWALLLAFLLACSHLEPARAGPTSSTGAPASQATSTASEPTTTLGPPADETEPPTSTVDSISVNLDDVKADESAASAAEDDSSSGSFEAEAEGIEPKSIRRDDGELEGAASSLRERQRGAKLLSINHQDPLNRASDKERQRAQGQQQLNMSHIDQLYLEGRRDAQATADSWRRLQKRLKKGVSSVIGQLVPFALNMSQEAKISSNCSGAVLKWILNMNQLKAWALRMLDASGKPIAGLLEGSMTMFGNYRQCLKIRAPDEDEIEFAGEFREYFRGKYCIIQAKPWLPEKSRFYNLNSKLESLAVGENEDPWYDRTIFDELSEWILSFNFVNIRYDLCVPSLCSREDIQKAIGYLLRGLDFKARVLRCETELGNGSLAASLEGGAPELAEALAAMASSAPGDRSDGLYLGLSWGTLSQLGWVLIPLVATSLVLAATVLSLAAGGGRRADQEEVSADGEGGAGRMGGGGGGVGRLRHTIRSLSLAHSVGSHLRVDYEQLADDKPLALYGLRFLLVLWVILVESAVNLKFEYLRELMMLKDLIFWWPMQFIINSSLQYDSFILLAAFTTGYKNCLNDGLNGARCLTRFLLDKYIRLMPSIMLTVALAILMPLVYRGPVWNDYVTRQSAVCQSNGWINSLFLQNYLPYDEICLPQTWLLCVEFQLILLMAPVVYYLNKSYSSKFGANRTLRLGNGFVKRPDLITTSTSRKEDSSKSFHWLWTKPGLFLVACMAFGLASSFLSVYHYELPPSWLYTMADPDSKALYFGQHLTKIWTHLAVFAMGLLAGVECRRASKNVIRGYRGANLTLIGAGAGTSNHHDNSLTGNHKSQSSSASSLPVVLSQADSSSMGLAATTTSSDLNNSSVSININAAAASGSHENINSLTFLGPNGGSDIGLSSALTGSHPNSSRSWSCRSVCLDFIGFLVAITTMTTIIFSTHDWSLNELPKPLVAGLFDAASRFLWSLAMIWILYMVSVPKRDRKFSLAARALGHPGMVCLGKLSFLIYILHPIVHTAVLAIQEQPIYSSWLMMFHILIGNTTITVILASLVSLFVEMPCRNLFRRCGTSFLLAQPATSGASPAAAATIAR